MNQLSPTRLRMRRLLRSFRETHEQTGSLWAASRYTALRVMAKAPLLIRQLRQLPRRKAIIREIAGLRDQLGQPHPIVGVRVSGGLGDYLVVARFLRDLARSSGVFEFDIYSTNPGRAQWVFGAIDGLRQCHDDVLFEFTYPEYDLALRVSQFVVVHEQTARWKVLRANAGLAQAAANAMRYRPKIEAFVHNHPYLDGFLAQKAVYANRARANFLHYMAGIPYGGDQLDIAVSFTQQERHGLTPQRYVTIHNGFDTEFVISNKQATKCYPHFGAVIGILKQRWPDLTFVQVGAATSAPIANVDIDLVDQTSLREVAGLIKGARLHIDNEGGLVHLARCLNVPSCVVFGPTPAAYFGYDGNANIEPTFCGGCWWINETWMDQCPRGFATARCMTEQDPRHVAATIDRHLSQRD